MQVTIIGSGYVGLVTGACLAKLGHQVTCVDNNRERVQSILASRPPFHEPGLAEILAETVKHGQLSATTDLAAALRKSDISMIAVGTPSADSGAIDLGAVKYVAREIGGLLPSIGRPHTVVVKSTVVPTTTTAIVKPLLEEASGMKAGEFGLAVNPEFLREGSAVEDFMTPDRCVIGTEDAIATQALRQLYAPLQCPVLVTTPTNAEMIKYTTNSLLATLISFSNEIAHLCEHIPGANEAVVMQGLHLDRRFRFKSSADASLPEVVSYLKGGIGFGGSCLPKDVKAISAFARQLRAPMLLLESVLQVNCDRAAHICDQLASILNGLEGKVIAVAGLAFKAGTDDIRESPAFRLIDCLLARGAVIRGYDPLIGTTAKIHYGERITLCTTLEDVASEADMLVLCTKEASYAAYDWNALADCMVARNIFDGRGAIPYDALKHRFACYAAGKGRKTDK